MWHDGFAGTKGRAELAKVCEAAGIIGNPQTTEQLEAGKPPATLTYVMDGKFPRVCCRDIGQSRFLLTRYRFDDRMKHVTAPTEPKHSGREARE